MRLILSQLDLDPHAGLANLEGFEEAVRGAIGRILPTDLLLLPELIGSESAIADYEGAVTQLAVDLGCNVVGGSHYPEPAEGHARINRGCVATPEGGVLSRYEKQNPYGIEHASDVAPGASSGCFQCGGRTIAVLLCADFWFSRVFDALPEAPDVVLVPAFSVSQKPDPAHPRALWRHMSVARAYEYGAFVGISDWAHPVDYRGVLSSGVAGLASPNPPLDQPFFQPLAGMSFAVFPLDFERLEELRENRRARGFV